MKSETGSSFVYDNMFKTAKRWESPRWYHVGDRVKWCGLLLRCQFDHYAGVSAVHPWDPGWGYGDAQAEMWRVLYPAFVNDERDAACVEMSALVERLSPSRASATAPPLQGEPPENGSGGAA